MAKKKDDDTADPVESKPDKRLTEAAESAAEQSGTGKAAKTGKASGPAEEPAEDSPYVEGKLSGDGPDASGRLTVTLPDGTTKQVEPDEYTDLGRGKVRVRR